MVDKLCSLHLVEKVENTVKLALGHYLLIVLYGVQWIYASNMLADNSRGRSVTLMSPNGVLCVRNVEKSPVAA